MLSDQCRELLSAYIDGELSARQRKTVLRLLHRSSEARALLRKMQTDSRRLRQLPRKQSEPELEIQVIQAFADQQARPERLPVAVSEPASLPLWLGVAVAAAVLLAVGIGSYFYFGGPFQLGNPQGPVATPDRPETPDPDPLSDAVVELVNAPRLAPSHEPSRDPEVLGPRAPVPKKELFQERDVKPSVRVQVHELDKEGTRKQLTDRLKKGNAFRVELPYRQSSARAFRRVQSALEAGGVKLTVDPVAQARLDYPQVQTNHVIYLEDVTPEELTQVLERLGAADKQANVQRREFTRLAAVPMTDADRKDLSQLLGIDARQLLPPRVTVPLGLGPPRLGEPANGPVLLVMAGQGGVPGPAKPAGQPADRQALALAYNPVRPRPGSPEVRRFLSNRRPPREGTVQVLLVLRNTP